MAVHVGRAQRRKALHIVNNVQRDYARLIRCLFRSTRFLMIWTRRVFALFWACAQLSAVLVVFGASATTGYAAPSGELDITAKLVEIPSKFPPDDLYDYAYVMRYEVIGGPMDKASILVAHYKPSQPRSKIKDKMKAHVAGKLRSFVQGDVHKLKLTADLKNVWKGPLIDEYSATDHKSVRYFCLQADPN
jgi:hypothetical protein